MRWRCLSAPRNRWRRWIADEKLSSGWAVHLAIQVERTKQVQQVIFRQVQIGSWLSHDREGLTTPGAEAENCKVIVQ
jgi:hypothetical protein